MSLLPELYAIVLEYAANRINKWKLHMTNAVLPELLLYRKSLRRVTINGKRIRRWPRRYDYGTRNTHYFTFCYDLYMKDFENREEYLFGNIGSIYQARSLVLQSFADSGMEHSVLPTGVVYIRHDDNGWGGRVFPFRGGVAFPDLTVA